MGEAERYPADFNGILDGDPVFQFVHGQSRGIWNSMVVYKDPAEFVPASKYPMVYKAVMDKCDAADGVKDGVINNPLQCHFDPSVLLCKVGDAPDCLTAGQVLYIESEYEGSVNPATHQLIVHGHEPGFEIVTAFSGRGKSRRGGGRRLLHERIFSQSILRRW